MKPYKAIFLNGKQNGAVRYYSELKHAKQAAKRYVNNDWKTIGEGNAYVEIYLLDEWYQHEYITTIE